MKITVTRLDWKYEISRYREHWFRVFISKLPRKIIYWSAIRLISEATTGKYSNTIVPELTAMEALKRWDNE